MTDRASPHPWNVEYAKGGKKEHPRVLRYEGANLDELKAFIQRAKNRKSGKTL